MGRDWKGRGGAEGTWWMLVAGEWPDENLTKGGGVRLAVAARKEGNDPRRKRALGGGCEKSRDLWGAERKK
jgi:hypothetical protein